MTVIEFKNIFMAAANARLKLEPGRNRERSFEIDQENKDILNSLVLYFMGAAEPLDPERGICMMGNVGSGKTFLLKTFRDMNIPGHSFGFIRCRDIARKFAELGYGPVNSIGRSSTASILFDDLGKEEPKAHYANREEIMAEIVQDRYELWVEKKYKTHFTCNISLDQIQKRYGHHVESRLRGMCNIVILGATETSKDRRI